MLGKALFGATVAGVLLIAGAGTGATLATWHAQTQVDLGGVRSGSIALTVNGGTTATLGTLSAMKPGDSRTVTATVTNAAPAGAKNLRMAVYVDGASTGSAMDGQLKVLDAGVGTCSRSSSGSALSSYKGGVLVQSLAPQQSVTFCMALLWQGDPRVPPAGLPESLQLGFRGQYGAWTAAAAATAGVTLLPAPPATAPPPGSLACTDVGSGVKLSWDAVTDATGYDVLIGSTVFASTGPSMTVNANQVPGGNDKYPVQVRPTNAGGPGPAANANFQVHVKNNGTVACQ